jgi:hypothetical protein
VVSAQDVAWLAGLLEGEGSFGIQSASPPRGSKVALNMTDRDIVQRAAELMDGPMYPPRRPAMHGSVVGRKFTYATHIYGPKAIAVMMTVYSFMGARRKAKIRAALSAWKASAFNARIKLPPVCHRDRDTYAKGLCHACYSTADSRKRRALGFAG